jgi:glycosyltransferase involved in cell wall biosynthesis
MCDLLVLSCDSYEDTWKIFFDLKKKYWKECPYETYIMTETKDCEYAKTIKTQGEWTKRVREALQQLTNEYVIIMLDDFFIRDYVKQDIIDKIVFNDKTAVYNFEVDYNNRGKGFRKRKNKEPYLLSCQPSMWNRLKLIELLKGDMNPWKWETQILDSPYEFYINTEDLIIDIGYYNYKQWSIKQSKWCVEIQPFFDKENIRVDYTQRGFYDMKLSIIIPVYNTTELTKKLLDKLRPQLTKECELIVVDDGSTEDTSILGDIYHKKNGGVSSARNYGLDKASGKYIVFIDSDDMISDDYIESILSIDDFDYCYFGWKSNGHIKGEFLIPNEPPTWNTCVWNCIYKKELIGNNRFDETKQIAEDEDFNKRVRKGKRKNINKILYDYNSSREDSLTRRFAAGLITKEVTKPQILVYQKFVSTIGGLETFLYEFFKAFHKQYDILFVYKEADVKQLIRYKELVKCVKFDNQQFICDKYICASNQDNIADNVKSLDNFYAIMIHADYKAMSWGYREHPKTNIHISVSKVAQRGFPKDSIVIYNLMEQPKPKRVLNIVAATRLSWEKGQDVINRFAQRLNERKIPFTFQVFTTDKPNKTIDGLIYREPTLDVIDYIADADYYFSGSKTESWGYSTYQAFLVGTPVISTNYPAIYEQGIIEGVNGYVLSQDLSNIDQVIDKVYSTYLKGFEYKKLDDKKQWTDLLGKGIKPTYKYDPSSTVKALLEFYDVVQQRKVLKGEIFEVKDLERLAVLLGKNQSNTAFVQMI